MKRALASIASAAVLIAMLPGAVAAERVTRSEDRHVGFYCEGPIDGGYASVHIDVSSAFRSAAGVDVWFDPAVPFEDPASLSGSTETVIVAEGPTQIDLSATVAVSDPGNAGGATGHSAGEADAVLEATMTSLGDPQPIVQPDPGDLHPATAGTTQTYAVTASLDLFDRTLDLTRCSGDVTAREFAGDAIVTRPSGPNVGGTVPGNDTPAGAIPISPGTRLNAQTGGASLVAEDPITTCPEGLQDNLGRTLWYKIEGTGGPVTFDTAGSDFDTVIAVYQSVDGNLTEIGCDDDVFSAPLGTTVQAALTIDTIRGETYFAQAGGFLDVFAGEPQSGRLRLRVD